MGVVSFILLCGSPPFDPELPRLKLALEIKKVSYSMDSEQWDVISQEAVDFVRQLLVKDPYARCQNPLKHPWLSMSSTSTSSSPIIPDFANRVQSFNKALTRMKLKAAVHALVGIRRLSKGAHRSGQGSSSK